MSSPQIEPVSKIPFLRSLRALLLPVFLFSCFINLLAGTGPLFMLQVVDRVLPTGNLSTLLALIFLALIALTVMAALDYIRSLMLARAAQWWERRAIDSLLPHAFSNFDLASRTSSNVTRLGGFIAGSAVQAVFDAPWAIVFFVLVYWLHPMLAGVGLGIALSLVGIAVVGHITGRESVQKAISAKAQANGIASHLDRNRPLLSTMGMAENLIHLHQQHFSFSQTSQRAAHEPDLLRRALAKFLRTALQVLVLGVGAWLVIEGELSGGAMIACSILLARALSPVEQLAGAIPALVEARIAYEQLVALRYNDAKRTSSAELGNPSGELSFENITVPSAPGRPAILHQVSCKFPAGQCIAIMGSSGAGKSTLAQIIAGALKPKIGTVRLDDRDLWRLSAAQRSKFVGYMPQKPTLFPGTIAENIARFEPGATHDEIRQAGVAAGVHGLISMLPDGYETQLAFETGPLSGGEQQRIALARTLYGGPSVIVLDEPNASLDREGERALVSALSFLKSQGTTIVMVAHRAGILTLADQVLLLDSGRIRDFGPRGEVVARMNARTLQIDLEREAAEMPRLEDWIASHFKRDSDAEVRSNAAMIATEMFNISLAGGRQSDAKKPVRFTLRHRRGMCTISMHDTCELIASSRVDRLRRIAADEMLLAPALEGSDLALLMVMQLSETLEQKEADYGRVIEAEIITPILEGEEGSPESFVN